MFNLESAISAWRSQMLAAGFKHPETLDELESHLRDAVERQMKSGANAQNAFEIAVGQIGQINSLKNEFRKNETNDMKKTLLIIAGIVGIAIGMAFVMPALAQYNHQGALSLDEKWLLPLGLVITICGLGTSFFAFKKRHA